MLDNQKTINESSPLTASRILSQNSAGRAVISHNAGSYVRLLGAIAQVTERLTIGTAVTWKIRQWDRPRATEKRNRSH